MSILQKNLKVYKRIGLLYIAIHNKVISGFKALLRPRRRWRGSNPLQKGPCRSQGGFISHCATDALVYRRLYHYHSVLKDLPTPRKLVLYLDTTSL
ncbi:hypothetical protein PoB_004780000 [Plakobranchus ocellatus]|uniref:Uncharacterized protein n=1 Tax=Plakobranchus ocellatus TaxID=259542 RepID=A0AAV4BL81_9GAST|nr:hypothetical protein PoB_004780000 [Plakobranchus ocellatus]